MPQISKQGAFYGPEGFVETDCQIQCMIIVLIICVNIYLPLKDILHYEVKYYTGFAPIQYGKALKFNLVRDHLLTGKLYQTQINQLAVQ